MILKTNNTLLVDDMYQEFIRIWCGIKYRNGWKLWLYGFHIFLNLDVKSGLIPVYALSSSNKIQHRV